MRKTVTLFFQLMLSIVVAMFYQPAQASPTGFEMAVMQPFHANRDAPVLAVQTPDTIQKSAIYFEVVSLHEPVQHVPLRHKQQISGSKLPSCAYCVTPSGIRLDRSEVADTTKAPGAPVSA